VTEFKQHSLDPLLKDSFSYAISKLIPGGVGLISVILFFRWVGPEEYGRYSLIFSFTNILAAFSFGWLNQSILRYGSTFKPQLKLFQPLSLGFSYGVFSLIVVIIIFSWIQFPTDFPAFYPILLACSIGAFNIIKVFYQSKESPKKVIWITSCQSILMVLFSLFFLENYKSNGISIIMGTSFGYLIPALFLLKPIYKTGFLTGGDKNSVIKFFKFGSPLSIWFGMSLSLNFLDRFFIEHFYGAPLMGSYAGFSEFIIRIFSIIIFPITLAIHPKLMNQWNHKKNISDSFKFILRGGIIQLTIFGICLLVLLIFHTQVFIIIQKLVPQLDNSMKSILIPLFIGGFLWQFALIAHKPLEIEERTKTMLICILCSVLINIVGNYIFLPHYGLIATAYTMILSALVYILSSVLLSKSFQNLYLK